LEEAPVLTLSAMEGKNVKKPDDLGSRSGEQIVFQSPQTTPILLPEVGYVIKTGVYI